MRILKIKTKTGIKTVYDVTDWDGAPKQAIFITGQKKGCITNTA